LSSQKIFKNNKKQPCNKNHEKNPVENNYKDLSSFDSDHLPSKRFGRGHAVQFPEKLHIMLNETSRVPVLAQIVSWKSHGRAFCVHDTCKFVEIILQEYFKQSKWESFTRQLNIYGFNRITRGVDSGSYYNECFLRGAPNLSLKIGRTEIKGKKTLSSNPGLDPNFYSMPYSGVSCEAQEPEKKENMSNVVFDETKESYLLVRGNNHKEKNTSLDEFNLRTNKKMFCEAMSTPSVKCSDELYLKSGDSRKQSIKSSALIIGPIVPKQQNSNLEQCALSLCRIKKPRKRCS